MNIVWNITSYCHYKCAGCAFGEHRDTDVVCLDRINNIVNNISLAAPEQVKIIITGGESTSHPLLEQIVAVIMRKINKVQIIIETHGSESCQYYAHLASVLPGTCVAFNFFYHPGKQALADLLLKCGASSRHGHNVSISLIKDQHQGLKHIIDVLQNGCAKLHYHFNVLEICPGLNQDAKRLFSAPCLDKLIIDAQKREAKDGNGHGGLAPADERFMLAGMDFLGINADGSYYGAPCGRLAFLQRLYACDDEWHFYLPGILACDKSKACNLRGHCMQGYASRKLASEHLDKFLQKKRAFWRLRASGIGKELARHAPQLYAMLSDLLPLLLQAPGPTLNVLTEIARHLLIVWRAIASDAGRAAFLHILQMPEARQMPVLAPCTLQMDDAKYKLETSADILQELKKQATLVARKLPPIEISMPLTNKSHFLAQIIWIVENYPEYKMDFQFSERDANLCQMSAFADKENDAHSAGGSSMLTAIVCVESGDDVDECLAELSLQANVNMEIIVIVREEEAINWKMLNEATRLYGMNLRSFLVHIDANWFDSIHSALLVARGKYVCILPASAKLHYGQFSKWHDMLENEAGDFAFYAQHVDDLQLSDNSMELREFLIYDADAYGVMAKLDIALGAFARLHAMGICSVHAAMTETFLQAEKRIYFLQALFLDLVSYNVKETQFFQLLTNLTYIYHLYNRGLISENIKEEIGMTEWRKFVGLTYSSNISKNKDMFNDIKQLCILSKFKQVILLMLDEYAHSQKTTQKDMPIPIIDVDCERFNEISACECVASNDSDFHSLIKPTISVIMPNYDKDKYLDASIASILNQSYANYELIIIDDASTDGSFAKLEEYAKDDSRIRLFQMQKNSLPGMVRNHGIALARGEYLIFADSDDALMPNFLANAIHAIETLAADIVIFETEVLDDSGSVTWTNSFAPDICGIMPQKKALGAYFNGNIQPAPWGKIFRKNKIEASGLRFAQGVFHQDVRFMYDCIARGLRIALQKGVACRYRQNRNSVIHPDKISYLHFHSVWWFCGEIQRQLEDALGESWINPPEFDPTLLLRWNLDNVLAPKIRALRSIGLPIPMTAADYSIIMHSPAFILALIHAHAASYTPTAGSDMQANAMSRQSCKSNVLPENCKILLTIIGIGDKTFWERLEIAANNVNMHVEILAVDSNITQHCAKINSYATAQDAVCNAKGKFITFISKEFLDIMPELCKALALLLANPQTGLAHFAIGAANSEFSILKGASGLELISNYLMPGKSFGTIMARKEMLCNLPIEYSQLPFINDEIAAIMICFQIEHYCEFVIPATNDGIDHSVDDIVDYPQRLTQLLLLGKLLDNGAFAVEFSDKTNVLEAYITSRILPFFNSSFFALMETNGCLCLNEFSPFTAHVIWKMCSTRNDDSTSAQIELMREEPMFMEVVAEQPQSDRPFVTVVVYARNCAKALSPDIFAVFANVEYILVDDCSDHDITWAVCKKLVRSSPNIQACRTARAYGKSICFQLGARLARGKLTTFREGNELHNPGIEHAATYLLHNWPNAAIYLRFDKRRMTEGGLYGGWEAMELCAAPGSNSKLVWDDILLKTEFIKENLGKLPGCCWNQWLAELLLAAKNAACVPALRMDVEEIGDDVCAIMPGADVAIETIEEISQILAKYSASGGQQPEKVLQWIISDSAFPTIIISLANRFAANGENAVAFSMLQKHSWLFLAILHYLNVKKG